MFCLNRHLLFIITYKYTGVFYLLAGKCLSHLVKGQWSERKLNLLYYLWYLRHELNCLACVLYFQLQLSNFICIYIHIYGIISFIFNIFAVFFSRFFVVNQTCWFSCVIWFCWLALNVILWVFENIHMYLSKFKHFRWWFAILVLYIHMYSIVDVLA